MRIGLVNLITRTADVQADGSVLRSSNLAPSTDADLNIAEMGRRMAARGHDVKVFVADAYRPEGRVTEVPAMEYLPSRLRPIFPPSLAPLTPSLGRAIRRSGLDVVQSGEVFQPGTMLAWAAARDPGVRMFVWQELDTYMRGPLGVAQREYYRRVGRRLVERSGGVIPRSLSARKHLEEAGFPSGMMSEVVHSGVDTNLFRPMNKESARRSMGVGEERSVLLSIGRLHENKGMDALLEAVAHLRRADPSVLLIIKGAGPQEGALRQIIRDLNLQENVMLLTARMAAEDMPALYNCADLLTISSRIDLFPFTAIEAISCGVPVATSFARGLRTDIVEKGAGVMVSGEPREMARQLSELLADPVRLDSMGGRARKLALEDFDFDVAVERLLRIYEGAS